MSKEWTARRFAWLAGGWAAAGIFLRLAALRTPFILDDFMLIGMDEHVFWTPRPSWDRFRFISGDPKELRGLLANGALPWWADRELKLAMFRPISSLLSAAELRVWGPSPALSHGLSLVLFGSLVFAVALVYRRLLPWRVAKFALPIYVLSRVHDLPVGWIANRSAILAATFGALALEGHVRWRRSGGGFGRVQSALCLALSLASGEYGVATFGLLLSFELFGVEAVKPDPRARGPWARRFRALLPAALVGIVYVAASWALGYGTHATGVYADPRTESTRFVFTTLTNLPRLIAEVLWPSPMRVTKWIGIPGVLVAIGVSYRALSEGQRRFFVGAALGGVIATLPLSVAAVPNPRLLEVPEIAYAAALATLLAGAAPDQRRVVRYLRRFLAWVEFILAPFVAWLEMGMTQSTATALYEQALAAPLSGRPTEDVILVAASEVFSVRCPPMARHVAGLSMPRAWWTLSVARAPHRLTRVASDTLDLRIEGAGLFDDPKRDTYQPPLKPLEVGTRLDAVRYDATILAVGEAGPTAIRFRFPENLDDPNVTLLTLGAGGYRKILPPPLGASLWLPKATLSPAVAPALRY